MCLDSENKWQSKSVYELIRGSLSPEEFRSLYQNEYIPTDPHEGKPLKPQGYSCGSNLLMRCPCVLQRVSSDGS